MSANTTKLDYSDINLIPKKCIVESRSECDTEVKFGGNFFKTPIIPANMESVINPEIAKNLAKEGYFYIMHRFLTYEQQISFVKKMSDSNLVISISVGVKKSDKQFISDLYNLYVSNTISPIDFITIDIAHGHAESVKSMIEYIKELMPITFIIAGNVSTPQAIHDLQQWGADAIKVGIGPGHSCTTYYMTGFGSRNCQATTVLNCAKVSKVPIIADGGIQHPGEIAIALVMGATMVMNGSLIAGCTDSPGELEIINGIEYKQYWGSASQHQSGKSERIEGTMKLIPYKNKTISKQMEYLQHCLQSSISYGGGNVLNDLNYVQWH